VIVVYKIALEIWGTPPLKKLAAQRYHNFCAISDNFATCSHISAYWIINRKTALQSANQGWVFAVAKSILAGTVEKTSKNSGKNGKNWQ